MRVKSSVYTRQRKKKYFRLAEGYYSNKRNRWRQVVQQVEKSLTHAYRDRKDKKKVFRQLWITRINAMCRESDISYCRFIAGLRKAGVTINRKMLAELAVTDADSFHQLTDIAKAALARN